MGDVDTLGLHHVLSRAHIFFRLLLHSLGALTRGDRRAAHAIDLSSFNLDTQYGRAALREAYDEYAPS